MPSVASSRESFALGGPIAFAIRTLGERLLSAAQNRLIVGDRKHRERLLAIVDSFRDGYVCATRSPNPRDLVERLSGIPLQHQGFAYEGAAMALALLDRVLRWRGHRCADLLAAAEHQRYLIHVGIGWALARTGAVEGRTFGQLDPLLRWLAIDAVGFHDGFLRGTASAAPTRRRAALSTYGRRAFDQGLGRSLWFTTGIDAPAIVSAIASEDAERQPDLWSGVGLASAYAGGMSEPELAGLLTASGSNWRHLAQGVAFGAEAHVRALGRAPESTERTTRLICAMTAGNAALVARECSIDVADRPDQPAYEVWRARVRYRIAPPGCASNPPSD